MITATFNKKNELITNFTIEGHANFASSGNDIVCAAVSALVIATSNTLSHYEKCEVKDYDGLFCCWIKEPSEFTETLMQPLLTGMNSISIQYETHVKVKKKS